MGVGKMGVGEMGVGEMGIPHPLISVSERVCNQDMMQVVTFDHNLKFHILKKSR